MSEVITYLPSTPDGLPLVGALYVHRGMSDKEKTERCRQMAHTIRKLAPGRLAGRLPEPGSPETILWVCHDAGSAREAISVADTRPVVAWAWLLDENTVASLGQRMPVVFGPQNTDAAKQRLMSLTPSEPEPGWEQANGRCAMLDHAWGIGAPRGGDTDGP